MLHTHSIKPRCVQMQERLQWFNVANISQLPRAAVENTMLICLLMNIPQTTNWNFCLKSNLFFILLKVNFLTLRSYWLFPYSKISSNILEC